MAWHQRWPALTTGGATKRIRLPEAGKMAALDENRKYIGRTAKK